MGRIFETLEVVCSWKSKLYKAELEDGFNFPSVLTNGVFDIIHAGHVRLFQFCQRPLPHRGIRPVCRLFVAVDSDERVREQKGEGRPITPLAQRLEIIAAFDGVTAVFSFDCPIEEVIKTFDPDVYVKDGSWEEKAPGIEFARKVVWFPMQEDLSTSKIVERIRKNETTLP